MNCISIQRPALAHSLGSARRSSARAPFLLLVALAASACDGGAERTIEGPAFATESAVAEFGDLWEGETRRHSFRLESVGTEPIVVQERLDTCGCSAIEWFEVEPDGTRTPYVTNEPIEPGHVLQLDVTFDSSGRRGPFDQPIRLYGPFTGERAELRLVANIRSLLEVEGTDGALAPADAALALAGAVYAGNNEARGGRFVDLGAIMQGQSGAAQVTLASQAGPVALSITGDPPPDVLAALTPLDPDARGRAERWRLDVELDREARVGSRLGTLTLLSDLEGSTGQTVTSRIHVQAAVRGRIEVVGGRVAFGTLDAGVPAVRDAFIAILDVDVELPRAPELELVAMLDGPHAEEDVSSWFSARWRAGTVDSPAAVTITAGPLPQGRFGAFDGVVRVPLGDPRQPWLEIPFAGTATGVPVPGSTTSGPTLPQGTDPAGASSPPR
ncbi:hypothetical protein Pla163_25540 [Planctomycetes bacterium Pla163]|uniref:DUF1573 domain-containing protein n=1 Tax=Rohdeia mirabilis TaxID=2528008 RepID=A0A518D1W5_9BACT|nr:hypothetical protein Pla163_25540 [Planctomycetes bacterium Pla163]